MKRFHTFRTSFWMALLILPAALPADVVETADGGRLTGTILSVNETSIELDTPYAGKLTVDRTKVRNFSTTAPLMVRLGSGTTITGKVDGTGGQLMVSGGDATLTTETVKVKQSWRPGEIDPEAKKYQDELAKKERKWKYQAGIDISGKEGNTEKSDVGVKLDATLVSDQDKLNFYASYSRSETSGVKSADETKGGVSYTSYFYQNLGWYARSELENDKFELIDLRSTSGLGLSYRFFKSDTYTLEGQAGLSYRYEAYAADPVTGLTPDGVDALGLDAGLEQSWQFAKWGRESTKIRYTASFKDFGVYFLDHDTGIELPLGLSGKWLLRLGVANSYNSQPAPGRKELDTTYYTRFLLNWE